ncbi:hypothetical protein FOXB_16405 [Fusarium oxysporum f. sp. conglutinans Fo5176]|uniref:chitinase n=1 Tax=Fusarium oxysporum (strain Fo5176) TaxID=660025 RepID=F9GCM2_FUSOF|nr:hypothetical protein FOXB_16405 [Fusarium oxysporum f. sp. conglutinans Fo5176]
MRFRCWLLVVLFLCLYVTDIAADDTTCSATKKCKQGCCNKNGNCGFGPDYCGKDVCRSDCDRKSDCNPGFGKQWAKSDKCPLNVCCSKHGYCGTTKDFCGSKTVKRPSCKKGGDMERVVGYFEGWAKNRPCEVFWPEQIPIGLYTHINFAFGTINPNTFSIEANDREDTDMYERLMLLKKKDKNLKIYLAIGGWTFNDPGPTAKIFSDLAASPARQKSFFNSVMSFMATHKFDGLDLDWEYPVAEERSGREIDYKTFPVFMAALKKIMGSGNKGLTITLPASYWYLQYFDIQKLEPTVDFFNIMSYDLHGAWDQNVTWTQPYLNAHTNLTEIDLALDLLWRNNIKPEKVVMGLGFYGRAFTAQSAACRKPGCLFSEPANAGRCSRENGILLNSEIDNEIKNRNLKPELYKEEAVKTVTWGKQWVSFDDEDTLKMKVDRAGERCLGGVMVWAISHDTRDAKYNKALAKVLGRKVTSGSLDDDEKAADFVKKPYEQCRWTNCKEPCPKGWVHVGRSDPGARKNELMYDETACGGDGIHSFCCPPNYDIPICGWWGHFNGKCEKESSCPSGMVEIGTNSMKCEKPPRVQTACCKPDTVSMRVYDTCRWGAYPECNTSPECPGDYYNWPMASSGSGSGALRCNDLKNDLGTPIIGVQMRNYCCNTKPGLRFIDCQVRRDFGPAPDGEDLAGYCRSGCPSDRVRVALDTAFHTCTSKLEGGQVTCCKTDYYDEVLVPNEKITAYKEAMADWLENETCPNPSKVLGKRSTTDLVVREDDIDDISPYLLLRNILSETGSPVMLAQEVNIWNSAIRARYEYLQITYISSYIRQNWRFDWQGPSQMAIDILCEPLYWAMKIKAFLTGDEDALAGVGNCTLAYCDEKGYCENLSDAEDSPDLKRRHAHLDYHPGGLSHSHHHHNHGILEARARKDIKIVDPSDPTDTHVYAIDVPPHPSKEALAEKNDKNPTLKNIVELADRGECRSSRVIPTAYRDPRIIQIERVPRLESDVKSKYSPIPIAFWDRMESIDLRLEPGAPALPGGKKTEEMKFIMNRAFECLGSTINDQVFMIVEEDINDAKGKAMQLNRMVAEDYLPTLVGTAGKSKEEIIGDRSKVLSRMRGGFSVFRYMQMDETKKKLNKIVKDLRTQFKFAESVYNKRYPNEKVQLADYWIEWITDYYALVSKRFRENTLDMVSEVRTELEGNTQKWAEIMRVNMRAYETQARNQALTFIDTSGFPKDDDTEMGGA